MISTQLLILQVVIPLIAAPLCIFIRRPALVWYFVLLVSWITFYIACQLLSLVLTNTAISYDLGGWAAPWGIEYRLDILNAFVLLLVTSIGAVVILFARESVAKEIAEDRIYLFYAAYLLNLSGILGVAVTGDVFNLFVFIEISSLSSYAMISLGQHRRALLAAFRYLILGTVGDHQNRAEIPDLALPGRSLAGRVRRGLGFVARDDIAPDVSIRDQLAAIAGFGRADHLLTDAPLLAGRGDDPAGLLSGGERRMLAWLRCLAHDPGAVVLDNAGRGLDADALAWADAQVDRWRDAGVALVVRAGRPEERRWALPR